MQDVGGSIHAYQQALLYDGTSRTALIALDRLYRRIEQWEPLIDVLTRRADLVDRRAATIVKFRLEVGQIWDLRLFDAGQAITAYQKVLDLDPSEPRRRCAPSRACTRRRTSPRSTSRSSRRSSTRRRPTPSASRCTSAWPQRGRSASASSTARPRRSRRSSRSTTATTRRTASSRACTSRPEVGSARRDLPQPHHVDVRRRDARRPLRRDGPDLRGGAAGRRSRDRGVQRRAVVRRRRAARARCPRPPVREDRASGTARST